MPVPKQRHTKSRRNKRRLNLYLEVASLSVCPKCGKPVLPHRVCLSCGYYKGVEVIDTLTKLNKKERKAKEKEMAAHQAEAGADKKSLSFEELSKK